jgi:hypothetical protein
MRQPPLASIPVGVLVERSKSESPWIDHVWRPVTVLAGTPETKPWTELSRDDKGTVMFYAGAVEIELHRTESGNYRDNLASGRPALWVALRPGTAEQPFDLLCVTADPAEGEALTEAGSDLVEQVPMPTAIAETIAAFVAQHHVERPFIKRKRDRADPQALARREPPDRRERRE